ncbi:hypothetical protein GCM10027160_09540 [Streptomyces calidiresistens]
MVRTTLSTSNATARNSEDARHSLGPRDSSVPLLGDGSPTRSRGGAVAVKRPPDVTSRPPCTASVSSFTNLGRGKRVNCSLAFTANSCSDMPDG